MKIALTTLFVCTLMMHGVLVQAQDNNKKAYHLFNPTPKDQMREFSIDRPDVTESPFSVDAGHFQFEGDFLRWEKVAQGDAPQSYNIINGLYKVGLTHKMDLHVGIELYNIYQDQNGNTIEKGYGNTTFRLKYNFWGNDGGRSGLGTIVYATLPTSKPDEDVTYGIAFPYAYDLTDDLGLGVQFQFDFLPDGENNYTLNYLQTVEVGGKLIGNFDFFVEGVGIFGNDDPIYTANGGIIFNLSPNVKIDIATNLGLVNNAYSNAFAGLSFRL